MTASGTVPSTIVGSTRCDTAERNATAVTAKAEAAPKKKK